MSTKLEIKRLLSGEIELGWQTKQGYHYEIERSVDFIGWVAMSNTYTGDGSFKRIVLSAGGQQNYFRLLVSMPQGTEPKTWTITYLDGSKVEVHWVPFGDSVPTGQFQIRRDGILIGVVTGDSDYFVDENVESGKTYTYLVGYYS